MQQQPEFYTIVFTRDGLKMLNDGLMKLPCERVYGALQNIQKQIDQQDAAAQKAFEDAEARRAQGEAAIAELETIRQAQQPAGAEPQPVEPGAQQQ